MRWNLRYNPKRTEPFPRVRKIQDRSLFHHVSMARGCRRVADKLCRFPALARTCERQGRGSATGAPTEDCVSLRETFQRCYKRGATARAKNESFVDYACGFGTKKRERGERQSSTHLNLSISPLPRSDPRFLLDASCRDHCVYVQANTRDANDDSHQNSLGWKL